MKEAHRRLAQSGYAALARLQCECENHDGVLVLKGRVPSYYLKQLAQSLLRDIDGIRLVVNNISVD